MHSVVVIETVEEDRVGNLLELLALELDMGFFEWSVASGLTRGSEDKKVAGTERPGRLLRHLEGLEIEALFHLKDLAPHLKDPAIVRYFRELAQEFSTRRSTVVLTGALVQLPPDVAHRAVYFKLSPPGTGELRNVVKSVLRSLAAAHDFELKLTTSEFEEILRALQGFTLNQARQAIAYAVLEDNKLGSDDIRRLLERKTQSLRDGGLLEYFPAEDNHYELGGFRNLKAWLERASMGFTSEARKFNLGPPRGILIVGVQGCGKSLAAKVLARQWRMPLLKLSAGRLLDKYIGESDKNLRRAISIAESAAPCVLWIDEIEKGFAMGQGADVDGGVGRRLFGAFITWLQEKREEVFVVATANDLSRLPPELMRKGRFDEIFFVDLPTLEERRSIFDIHLRLKNQDVEAFDLDVLAEASEGFSGAEIEQVIVAGLYRVLHAKCALDVGILLDEVSATIPLSVARAEDVEHLRTTAKGRYVAVS
jgi:hypothetical protein